MVVVPLFGRKTPEQLAEEAAARQRRDQEQAQRSFKATLRGEHATLMSVGAVFSIFLRVASQSANNAAIANIGIGKKPERILRVHATRLARC